MARTLHSEKIARNHRVIGNAMPGINANFKWGTFHNLQFTMEVKEEQEVWLQCLCDANWMIFDMYKTDFLITSKLEGNKKVGEYVPAFIPERRENKFTYADNNNWCYILQPGNYFFKITWFLPSAKKYLVRAVGNNLDLKFLDD